MFGKKRAQSAMEYLMTYGWAILVIAIVLVALYYMGIFGSGGSFTTTSCIPSSGYMCSNPILHNGNLNITLGEMTGTSWTNAIFCFVPSGSTLNTTVSTVACTSKTGTVYSGSNGPTSVASGQTMQESFNVGSGYATAGATIAGQVWAVYQISGAAGAPVYATEIGTLTAKAV
ncbi:MAG: hypothetical protein ACP5TL_00315 [Candidatus Micrarchaeia archaeon]